MLFMVSSVLRMRWQLQSTVDSAIRAYDARRIKVYNEWTETNFERCFQLMECDDPSLFING